MFGGRLPFTRSETSPSAAKHLPEFVDLSNKQGELGPELTIILAADRAALDGALVGDRGLGSQPTYWPDLPHDQDQDQGQEPINEL